MALRLKGLKGTKGRAEQRQGTFRGLGGLSQQAFRGFDCPIVLFVFLRQDLTYPRQAFIILLPVPSVTRDYRCTPVLWFYMTPGSNLGPHAC